MDDHEDLETLGEKLYTILYPKHKDNAGKITGMLLELPVPVLNQMLRDEASLATAVDKALGALEGAQESSKAPCEDEDKVSASSDSLGEQLFELVDIHNTGYSQKITGMLLEQNKDAVLQLLSDPKLLEEQVNSALRILKKQIAEETDVSDSSDAEDKEGLGDKIFSLVEELDPLYANDITGMLLEMDQAALRQLICDRKMLDAAVRKAQAALNNHK
ncbi:unnamed protein product [Tetraodon nigroviridis]|uniref:(spotted green pufferfish) hypothetical protein n=1 Tax=Tetraodon nigroviridis TaxID=99883 RepID=Q4TBX5_TETNG|nr:unnamed protein product [Tetraodon nigroviridis]